MNNTYKKIQTVGGRVTRTRRAIIEILSNDCCLLNKKQILQKLKDRQIEPDRSTLYREIIFLTKNQIISKSSINGVDYFEIPEDHHHHLICLICHHIEKVEIGKHLKKEEKIILKEKKFNIVSHSLDFYGHCSKCQM